ncbi:nucleolar pre-ribosomal-associated protein 1-like, partial [Elysia marginata]
MTTGEGKLPGKVLEIISALELGQFETCAAVKRLLLSSPLLHSLTISKSPAGEKTEASRLKKRPFISQEYTVIFEVLSLFKSIFKKTVNFQWFQKETHLIQKHLDMTIDLVGIVLENRGRKSEKNKPKPAMKTEGSIGDEEISLCCYDILHLLYEIVELKPLSGCLSKLLKLLPLAVATERTHTSKSSALSSDTADSSTYSKFEELLVKMLSHWTESMAANLMPDGIDVVLSNSYLISDCQARNKLNSNSITSFINSGTLKQQGKAREEEKKEVEGEETSCPHEVGSLRSMRKALKLKVVLSFEEVSGLSPEHLKPLFDQVFSQVEDPLMSSAVQLVKKLPHQLTSVCAQCVPDSALSSAAKLHSSVGPDVAKLLIKSEVDVFRQVNSWLQRWKTKRPKQVMWWLVRAFLEAKDFFAVDCQESIEAVRDCTQHCLTETLASAGEDELVVLKLMCAYLQDNADDSVYVETVFTAVAAAIKERPREVNMDHYELLLVCVKACPSLTVSDTTASGQNKREMKLESRILQLALQHLGRLTAEKRRDAIWEDYLLSLALKLVKPLSPNDFSFLPSLWGSFVKNTLRHLYKNADLLELLAALAPLVYSKTTGKASPQAVKAPVPTPDTRTLFNMCYSHTGFLVVLMSGDFPQAKGGLVKLLYTLAEIDPSCYDKQLRKIVIGAYGATLSLTDQYLLHMIEKVSLDEQGKFECPLLWGKSVMDEQTVTEALGSTLHRETPVADILGQLNVRLLHQSMLNFPLRQTLKGERVVCAEELKSKPECYDPRFLLKVLATTLTPDKRVPLHQFVDKGCLGYLLTALSSHDLNCRLLAYQALNDLHLHAQGSRWSERTEVSFLLDLLNASRSQDGQKLSSVVALFFARVSRLLLYPADALYMPIFRFLVARPEMDLRNVPEFYKLFFSPGSNYKQERNWSLSLLADGLRETSDYWLYQKKSVFRIILSFYGSAISDKTSQALVLFVVRAACAEKSVAVHLVKEHGLLTWLSAAVDGLVGREEHCDAVCEIIHTLWVSLSRQTHQARETSSEEDEGNDEQMDEEASKEDDVSDGNDEDDNDCDDNKIEEGVESSDSSDEERTTSQSENPKKRKSSLKESGSKRQKLDDSLQRNKGSGVGEEVLGSDKDLAVLSSKEDNTERSVDNMSGKQKELRTPRRQLGKKGTQTRMPKSTIAELGLLIKAIIWHLRIIIIIVTAIIISMIVIIIIIPTTLTLPK